MDLEEIARMYDPTAPERDFDYWLIGFDFEAVSNFIIGEKVIELGCARGVVTEKLAHVCKQLVVVEGSKRNIDCVSEKLGRFHNVKYVHSLWQDFDSGRADVSDVVFFSGLEHLDKETAISVLKKAQKWLRPGGRLHVVVPNAYSLHRRVAFYMGIIGDVHEFSERDRMLGHQRVYDKDTLLKELRDCDYKVLHWEGIFLKPLPNSMMNFDERIIRGFHLAGRELPDYCAHILVVCEK
jgi:2-polyprenyl-3-methyl-5-hydroxy-6-metoxy-1,4-benzoquinol methylase